ncbi:NaeI family type II restriction endonuclease [Streptomyces sp. IB201691-2A2]|uniref:NaeI family type II restriction endonuclease n=1 Tax=Streptomyces sp. IB201691-2A2 TaxID=2561920 RepID=UPI001181754C|nr:NaeI family type II restriction endonuclease [Streptomyces sp. IB201691-2A2]TRO69800.1 restriction endonuclease [Streptomyces sp. IB201691-2A2]
MEDSLFPLDIAAAQKIANPSTSPEPDPNLLKVRDWFKMQSNLEARFGQALRQSIDEVLDGQRTGRFNIKDLEKTEKTYLGTKVEIITRAEFNLGRGEKMDFSISGHDVDSKFTSGDNWTIPREADGHICLLIKASDIKASYQVGLLRIHETLLNLGANRDGKRTPSAAGREAIQWIIPEGRLPENILLNLPDADINAIFKTGSSGQARTNELFLRVQGRLVNRNTVLTVARQDDSLKRVRDARHHLRSEGIMILGHQKQHPHIARALGLRVPDKGSWISIRVAHADDFEPTRRSTRISGQNYAVWKEGDSPVPAPTEY